MRRAKIQLKGRFAIDRRRPEPLSLQIVDQLQDAIEAGRIVQGTRLPSTRSLARALRVSRNTVLIAYAELAARGLVWSRRGAGLYVSVPAGIDGFDPKRVMRGTIPGAPYLATRPGRKPDFHRLLGLP